MACDHVWVYDNVLLLSNPPQQRRICRHCGKIVTDKRVFRAETYDEVFKKFHE